MSGITFDGPGGTVYQQIGANDRGRIGKAEFDDGAVRLRVEPASAEIANEIATVFDLDVWKHPEKDNLRFSAVVAQEDLADVLATACTALGIETAVAA